MKQDNMVSIIVPVYNAEGQLKHCLNSIITQEYTNTEIILIDDGSTDTSGGLCDSYARMDSRIKAIHQKNAGPSHARNVGINAATGKFIQFVDADDSINPQTTKKLVEAMTNTVQLVIGGYQSIDKNKTEYLIPPMKGAYQDTEFIQHLGEFYKKDLLSFLCNKLYRTKLITDSNIYFKEDIRLGEDLLFNLDYIDVCDKFNIVGDVLYNYLHHTNSLSRNFTKDLFKNQQMLHWKVKEFLLKKESFTGKNKEFLNKTYTDSILNALNNPFHTNSTLTIGEKKQTIATIISDDSVRQNKPYFYDTLQSRLIGRLIYYQSVNGVYWFFKMKSTLKYRMHPLFNLLKGTFGS